MTSTSQDTPVRKVLVANRGEIACRIIETCRRLGIAAVAVYSEADARARHVELADEACAIGPAPARESYLDGARLLEAARVHGAGAVHPGYGFLAESPEFARAVEEAGLVWIGARPATIADMGDKERARAIAAASGVPVLPGSGRFPGGDLGGLEAAAAAVGFPLLVKASAGGGGIGMRRVDRSGDLRAAVAGAQSHAARAFGDGAVYLERFVPLARHVEVQVFGFGDGEAVHLHDRDCSLQRRFQKIVEEAPAPGLPGEVRARMAEAAVAICRHQRYRGAGTVEFVVDARSFDFFFLEMNTRIQVEHPVTEMTTGRDLIAMQIDLARGALAHLSQDEVVQRGHAIECRLYAENPAKGFFPSPGVIAVFRPPAVSESLRIDTGVREGDEVTVHYDPMIAKVITCGETRAQAIARMEEALAQMRVEGPVTNLEFLRACMRHEAFRRGDVSTAFVDEHRGGLVSG